MVEHYILGENSLEPEVDKEKYVWYVPQQVEYWAYDSENAQGGPTEVITTAEAPTNINCIGIYNGVAKRRINNSWQEVAVVDKQPTNTNDVGRRGFNEGECKVWNGYKWVVINDNSEGVIREELIPKTIARKTDLINLLRGINIGDYISYDDSWQEDIEARLNNKADRADVQNLVSQINQLDNRVDNLEDRVDALETGGSGGSGGGDQPSGGGAEVESQTEYYLASSSAEPPSLTDNNGNTNRSEESRKLSSEKPYLWYYIRINYTNSTHLDFGPILIKSFNPDVQVDYERVREMLEDLVGESLAEVSERLNNVDKTGADINLDSEAGLIQLLSQYRDGNNKSFADIILDGTKIDMLTGKITDEGKLSWAGIDLDSDAVITEQVGQMIEDKVQSAMQQITPTTIVNTVADGTSYWENDSGDVKPYTTGIDEYAAINPNYTLDEYNTWVVNNKGYTLKFIAEKMSVLEQRSDKIGAAIGEGDNVKASIELLSELEEGTGDEVGKIRLTADKVVIDGELVTSLIKTGMIQTLGGNVTITDKLSSISGWILESGYLHSGAGQSYVGLSSDSNNNYAIWAGGSNPENAPFSIQRDGTLKASKGMIGGWNVNTDSLSTGSGASHVALAGENNSSGYAIGAGSEIADENTPFSITRKGKLTATSGIFKGDIQLTNSGELGYGQHKGYDGYFAGNKGFNLSNSGIVFGYDYGGSRLEDNFISIHCQANANAVGGEYSEFYAGFGKSSGYENTSFDLYGRDMDRTIYRVPGSEDVTGIKVVSSSEEIESDNTLYLIPE